VAIKVLAMQGRGAIARFAQEARVLAELAHPAIVRYVGQGVTADGQPFLAMEWLDGEDLAARLDTRPGLSVHDSIVVATRAAEGLAAAHARGIVHRDIKPRNLFLVGREPSRAKVVDFGIARLGVSDIAPTARLLTGTGTLVGTVGYMSPEQAVGAKDLDPRTDVFAIGCVLFECLTGQRAFAGIHLVAVLAKVLHEEAPRVRALRPDLPPELDDVVARLMAKDPERRPADGAAVLRELRGLEAVSGVSPTPGTRMVQGGLSATEQRLVSVLLVSAGGDGHALKRLVECHGAVATPLANGAVVATLAARRAADDPVVSAAGCALAVRDAYPDARVALAMARTGSTGRGPPGAVIDRAAALLTLAPSAGIVIDEITSGLLDRRFEIDRSVRPHVLLGRADDEIPRTLLGKTTPTIGRDKELNLLEATLRESVEERVARAVLVTATAGQGKSRLARELVARARARGDVRVWMARGDPVGAGSAFALGRQIVRAAAGVAEADSSADQLARIRSHVSNIVKSGDVAGWVVEFLGELLGLTSTDASPRLRAARDDAATKAAWLRRAFLEWLGAECASPVLVVLEDAHWGDPPSLSYLGDALRQLRERPLMLLALARPDVRDGFPKLWAGAVHELPLDGLTRRAAERLVHAVLGDMNPQTVARIVERAEGNAFYIEELMRHVAEGGEGDSLPETVMALLESRFERLEPTARRVLRAASVFGEVSWRGGIAALLGGSEAADLDGWLDLLVDRELLTSGSASRFSGEAEYAFRHGLLRDAAYATLTDDDRAVGHALAAGWLENAGEKDALVLADHWERGGAKHRALPYVIRAAAAALEGGRPAAVFALVERGVDCGAQGIDRGTLAALEVQAHASFSDWPRVLDSSEMAMALLPAGSPAWFAAAAGAVWASTSIGDPGRTAGIVRSVVSLAPPVAEATGAYAFTMEMFIIGLIQFGECDLAMRSLERLDDAASFLDWDPIARAWIEIARSYVQARVSHELGAAVRAVRAALAFVRETPGAAAERVQDHARFWLAVVLAELGDFRRAEPALREEIERIDRSVPHRADTARIHLAFLLAATGRSAEGRELLRPRLGVENAHSRTGMYAAMAEIEWVVGRPDDAERWAKLTLETPGLSLQHCCALATLARTALAHGRHEDALELVQRGMALGTRSFWMETQLRTVRAEALDALGQRDAARLAIRDARERVLRIASTLDEAEVREGFLANHARTLALARDWLDGEQPR
jgi:hypothetical protein